MGGGASRGHQGRFENWRTFSSENAQAPLRPIGDAARQVMRAGGFTAYSGLSARVPPDHTRLRAIVQGCFGPRRFKAIEPQIRAIVAKGIDAFIGRGHADFVREFAYDTPALVLFKLVGIPDSDVEGQGLEREPRASHLGQPRRLRARKNDVHVPLSFGFAQELLTHYPDADADIVSLAILLHDIGWWNIEIGEIIEKAFTGPDMMRSDVRVLHEQEGVRLSREILPACGWEEPVIAAVGEIIEGHDTRPVAKSLNDKLVRDADRLWRYTVTGIAVATDWFRMTPSQLVARHDAHRDEFDTAAGAENAARELAHTRRALMTHLL